MVPFLWAEPRNMPLLVAMEAYPELPSLVIVPSAGFAL